MNVRVDPNRFLSVACEPDERIVFDRQETKYHLLRDSAARLWDEICEGGTFEIASNPGEGEDPVALLADAGLLGIDEAGADGITRRVWLRRTGKVSAAAVVLPLVATITAPRLVLGQGTASVEDLLEPAAQPESATQSQSSNTGLGRNERRGLKDGNSELSSTPTEIGNNGDNGRRTRTRTGQQTQLSGTQTGNSDGENGTRTRRRTGQQLSSTQESGPSSTGQIKRSDRK